MEDKTETKLYIDFIDALMAGFGFTIGVFIAWLVIGLVGFLFSFFVGKSLIAILSGLVTR
jgi:hypothetical protein